MQAQPSLQSTAPYPYQSQNPYEVQPNPYGAQSPYPALQQYPPAPYPEQPQYIEAYPMQDELKNDKGKSPEEEGADAKKCCLVACCVCVCSTLCILCCTQGRVGGQVYGRRGNYKRRRH
eukprot:TRINITY_DN0_c1209_g1_i1.p2 TRINITY_DN0_c1209_g1~~TRINITY_DN0_c1209_g1_i1.p2  ORF type:complete len:119 (-),score=14.85 TRINITY_DN0_c1209_g1_i1:63-419(-)